jgi:predicted lipase
MNGLKKEFLKNWLNQLKANSIDWQYNFKYTKEKLYLNDSDYFYCHKGFKEKALSVLDFIVHEINYTNKKVIIGGHSQGGVIAQILTILLFEIYNDNKNKNIECFTCGSPKAFRKTDKRKLDKKYGSMIVNLQHGNDLVTKLPYTFLNYDHIGQIFHIGADKNHWKFWDSIIDHSLRLYQSELKKTN